MNPIFSSQQFKIWVIPSGPFETNCYVIACTTTKSAIVIDPAPDSYMTVFELIKKNTLSLSGIVLTHSHWDHIADCSKIIAQFPSIPISIHDKDRPNLESPGTDKLPCWLNIQPVKPTRILGEGDTVSVGSLQFTVLHTPGHSPGGICLYNEKEGILISGDTLFQGTYGNVSFPTSEPEKMVESLSRLSKLPATTLVFPGHGDPTTIGAEKNWIDRL